GVCGQGLDARLDGTRSRPACPEHGGWGDMKRSLAATFLVGIAVGLSGCQSPMLGGLSLFNWNGSASSTAPDVSKQKYSGLSQQLAGSDAPSTGLGGNRTPPKTGIFASLTKSTAAATSA